jgi:hypothetical protein
MQDIGHDTKRQKAQKNLTIVTRLIEFVTKYQVLLGENDREKLVNFTRIHANCLLGVHNQNLRQLTGFTMMDFVKYSGIRTQIVNMLQIKQQQYNHEAQ